MVDGVLITRPAKKYQEITEATTTTNEPKVIDLQDYAKSKAGSVPFVQENKMKAIHDFINHGRY